MKKKILVLIIGVLLAGANAYAGDGDLIVQGKVGIGTATPGEALDVDGSINMSASGSFKQDNTTVLNTTINHNTFVGRYAGYGGYWNTAVGEYSLDISYGYYNTAVGHHALMYNTSGGYNVAVGAGSLYKTTTGGHNVAMGHAALYLNTTGSENTALGYFALSNVTEGNNNIGIGLQAGDNITSGSNNIIIGYDIDAPSDTGSNQLSIGNLIFGTNIYDMNEGKAGIGTVNPEGKLHTEDLLLDLGTGNCPTGYTEGYYGGGSAADCLAIGIVAKANGSVGIGTTAPTEKLYVDGNIYATGAVTWGSSREMKENIRELTSVEALTALNELQPKKFMYRTDRNDEHVGFIAEEVPELLATKDRKSLNPMDIIAVLTSVVKEQQKEMEELKAKVRKLEAGDYMAEALQ